MFQVNNKETRNCSDLFTAYYEHFTPFFSVSIVDLGQVSVCWDSAT